MRNDEVDLRALVDGSVDSGIPHGDVLGAFAAAVVDYRDTARLAAARRALSDAMGPAAMVDAAGVASNFERMVRIADATGIELGEQLESASAQVRAELGVARAADWT